jgi:hypothetical protein
VTAVSQALRAVLSFAVLLGGCAGSSRPFDKVALIPSYWEIVCMQGSDVVGDPLPILTIGRSNSARVALTCGEVDLRYTADTDGAALSFGEQRVVPACDQPADQQDAMIRAAITSVQAWRVISDTDIELLGRDGTALLSLQATSCNCPHQPPGTGAPTSS